MYNYNEIGNKVAMHILPLALVCKHGSPVGVAGSCYWRSGIFFLCVLSFISDMLVATNSTRHALELSRVLILR